MKMPPFLPSIRNVTVIAIAVVSIAFGTGFRKATYLSGEQIMQGVRDRHLADSELDLITMVTMDAEGNTQTRSFVSVVARDNANRFSYLIRFLSPEDVRGVTLLTVENEDGVDQWLYLPALGEPRRVSGSTRAGNFMGSDFTFEDLRREDPREHDHHRLQDDYIDGRPVFTILSAPAGADIRQAADYAHRILHVDKEDFSILRIDFYDTGKRLTRTFVASGYNSPEIEGTSLRPQRAIMSNHGKSSTSMLHVRKSRLNVDLPTDLFTVDFLRNTSAEGDAILLNLLDGDSN